MFKRVALLSTVRHVEEARPGVQHTSKQMDGKHGQNTNLIILCLSNSTGDDYIVSRRCSNILRIFILWWVSPYSIHQNNYSHILWSASIWYLRLRFSMYFCFKHVLVEWEQRETVSEKLLVMVSLLRIINNQPPIWKMNGSPKWRMWRF